MRIIDIRALAGAAVGMGAAGLAAYGWRRSAAGRALRLPGARYAAGVERGLSVPMPDGITLRADHYSPRVGGAYPTILVRSPYGRGSDVPFPLGVPFMLLGRFLAAHGYHVLIQTTRGRFDSQGTFDPGSHEATDGQATVAWIARQPWFNGALGLWGPSYMGFAQWAIAREAGPYLKALVPTVTASQLGSLIHADESLALDLAVRWVFFLDALDRAGRESPWRTLYRISPGGQDRALAKAFRHLPLLEIDTVGVGHSVPFSRTWLTLSGVNDPYLQRQNHSAGVVGVKAPVHFVGGWYDLMLREMLVDYTALAGAGRKPYLTIGPWAHNDLAIGWESLREGIRWFDTHLKGASDRLRPDPIRVYVMGAREWRALDRWPPPARETRYFLRPGRHLARVRPPADAPPDRYRYDPADPTPAVGGTLLMPPAGPLDNRRLETRPDVLCYSTAPLTQDVEVIGPVCVELYVRSSLAHTDFFARVCDVYPDGRSINLCDGLVRLAPGRGEPQADGSLRVVVSLWPTANRFLRGHRIRLQVSSGAHPRWIRNLGTGEPLATGTRMLVADQTIYCDSAHPSALILPVAT